MYVIMDGMYVRGDSLIIKLLFLKDSSTLCYSNSLSIFLHCFSDPHLMEGLSHYIEFSKLSSSYSCSSSNPALKYVSYQASSMTLCERYWLKPLFRSLLHINAARKVAAVHLCGGGSFFPRYFYILIFSIRAWSLSSLLESLGRSPKSPRRLLDWYSSGSRSVTSSDLSPPLFPYATIYSETFPVICFSSDTPPLANRA